jgi:hypothetical protein
MVDEVEQLIEDLDLIKDDLADQGLSESDLLKAREAVEALRAIVRRSAKKAHSLAELKGLGKEFWRSIDVDEYLRKERDSWD